MLEKVDLSAKLSKTEYKQTAPQLALELAELQRRAKELKIPVVIVFEGWDAAGKGTLINELILPLDPRGFTVYTTVAPNSEESYRPYLWRFWIKTPASGRIAIFERSWYRKLQVERIDFKLSPETLGNAFDDTLAFERQLADGGAVIIKFFLHIDKKEQRKRFRKLESNKALSWRVSKSDWKHHKQYELYHQAAEEMIERTDTDFAPWTIVESTDQRFATVKIFATVIEALKNRIRIVLSKDISIAKKDAGSFELPDVRTSALDTADLTLSIEKPEYSKQIKQYQERLRELEHELYTRRIPLVVAFEGWDAAGKGGIIKRLTQELDPRGYEVVPIAAPNDIEKAHHYLWRFWTAVPKAGHVAIFDRSWYGRVMVERVEGFCSEADWRRAYREINEFELSLARYGTIVVKFWLHISKDEQLRRFEERKNTPYKQWKLTDEDWRNREKWDVYKDAVDEMLYRTSTTYAPWTIIENDCKYYGRLKALKTVIDAVEAKIE